MRRIVDGEDHHAVVADLGVTAAAFERLSKAIVDGRRAKPLGQLPLAFRDLDPTAEKRVLEDISAIAATDDAGTLWIGVDEGAALERLTAERDRDGRVVGYGGHVRFDLHKYFAFPNGSDEEADVEGLAIADGFLWVVGSHSLKRKKPQAGAEPDDALKSLTRVVREANRFLLGRVPLVSGGDGTGPLRLARSAAALDGGGRKRRAGSLKMGKDGNTLSKRLRRDPHLGPFMRVPSKDNGLDVEGMAVSGDRIFLGLRGPVLRGWATILEMRFRSKKDGRLKLNRFDDGDVIRRHFLDLDGLGVRSLLVDGDDLVVLAGPTMDLDGPVRLYRWRGGLDAQDSTVAPIGDVERALDLPFGEGCDHAEGATMLALAPGEPKRLVVAYDTPARGRLVGKAGVLADVFEAPRPL